MIRLIRLFAKIVMISIGSGITMFLSGSLNAVLGSAIGFAIVIFLIRPKVIDQALDDLLGPLYKKKPDD